MNNEVINNELKKWKKITTIVVGISLAWLTLNLTGFSIGNFKLVVSCFVDEPIDFLFWCALALGFFLFIFKDKIGKYFLLVFFIIGAFIQTAIYFRSPERIISYNNHFKGHGTHYLFQPSDTFIIKDTYHIFIDIVIIASLFCLIVFIVKGFKNSRLTK